MGQWECGVCVVEPRRRPERTPHADNDKQGIRGTDGFLVFAATQPRRLPANHGKRPRTNAQN